MSRHLDGPNDNVPIPSTATYVRSDDDNPSYSLTSYHTHAQTQWTTVVIVFLAIVALSVLLFVSSDRSSELYMVIVPMVILAVIFVPFMCIPRTLTAPPQDDSAV